MKTNELICKTSRDIEPAQVVKTKKTLADGKAFGGSQGRMTDAMTQNMSEMYGLAIRQGADEN